MGKNQEMLTKWRMSQGDKPCRCDLCKESVPRHWLGAEGPHAGVRLCPECQFRMAAEEVLKLEAKGKE